MTKEHLRVGMMIAVAAGLVVSAAAQRVSAQSLGEVARQEEARRKAIKAPVKVYTNESLVQILGETIPTPPGPAPLVPKPAAEGTDKPAADAPGTPPAPGATPAPAEPPKNQEYWQKRIGEARDLRDRNLMYQDAMQTRINSLWADFTARDDPAQRALIGAERQRALTELDRLKKEGQDLEKQIATIEDEARKAGVPPGWLRLP